MSNKKGFEALKQDFPVFQIENKTSVGRILDLIGDDDVLIPANAIVPIDSSKMYQMPNSSYFRVREPKMSDLIEYGILKPAESPKTEPSAKKDDKVEPAKTGTENTK